MKRKIRRTLLWSGLSLLFLIIIGAASVYFVLLNDEDRIKELCINELNKQLNTKVSIDKMNFTIFSSFPYVALDFKGVRAEGANKKDSENLLEANIVSLNFNIRDIFSKKYEIRRIDLYGAKVLIKYYKDQSNNFTVWKKKADGGSSNFTFALKKINLRQTSFHFVNELTNQDYLFYIHKIDAKGDFSNTIQKISLSGHLLCENFQSGDANYLKNKDIFLQTQFEINSKDENIKFEKSVIRIEKLDFDLFGLIQYKSSNRYMDLQISGRRLQLHDLKEILPREQAKMLESYKSKGLFDASLQLIGKYQGKNLPAIKAKFAFSEGTIFEQNTKTQFEKVNFSGEFSCPNLNQLNNAKLSITNLSAAAKNSSIQGNFGITNFKKPNIRASLLFDVQLAEIFSFFKLSEIEQINGSSKGSLKFAQTFDSFKEINAKTLLKADYEGDIYCKNTDIKFAENILSQKITADTMHLKINTNNLTASYIRGSWSDYRFLASVRLDNFWAYLTEEKAMDIVGNLRLDTIKIEGNANASEQSQSVPNLAFLERINFNVNTVIPKVSFQNFSADNLKFRLSSKAYDVNLQDIYLETLDGRINASLSTNLSNFKHVPFYVQGNLFSINAEKMLKTFNNFNQEFITDKNLSGLIYADFDLSGVYSYPTGIDSKSLHFKTKTVIEQGELKQVEMLQKLSRFIDEDVLDHVKFANLENTIELKDEQIIIPEMLIRSNAINLTLSGKHSFDKTIDYSFKIGLSELLSKKRRERRKSQEELGTTVDDKKRTTLYVHIFGTTDNPRFKYDFKNVMSNININKESLKKEKETVKTVFKEELLFLQKSEENKKQEALWKEQEKGKFVIEWEQDSVPPQTKDTKKPPKTNSKREAVKYKVEFEDD